MKRTESEYRELRWRAKGTLGLIVLGGFLGALAWLWPALGGEADLQQIVEAGAASAAVPAFWGVVAASAALGGWLALILFWRGGAAEQPRDDGPDGMAGPKF